MMGELFGPRNRDGRGRRKPVQLCFEAMESRLMLATTFLVTNTDNSGSGSLRQAILDADAAAATEPATIDFQISSGGLQTISPLSPLPAITAPVIIDGTSQPGFDPNHPTPMIELTGSNIAEELSQYKWPDDQRRQQHGEGNGDQQVQRVGDPVGYQRWRRG